jgi:hypothetical protein
MRHTSMAASHLVLHVPGGILMLHVVHVQHGGILLLLGRMFVLGEGCQACKKRKGYQQ